MDISQLLIVAVAVAGAVVVGLLAIVPTVLELPRRREATDPAPGRPTPRTPKPRTPTPLDERRVSQRRSDEHKLAA